MHFIRLVEVAAEEQLECLDLIAVGGADAYWHQFGFRPSGPETQAGSSVHRRRDLVGRLEGVHAGDGEQVGDE